MLLVLFAIVGFVYFGLQTSTIYGGDAGDLISAAYLFGVAHPPGFPLYTLVGHFLTKIPFSTVAWRVSFLSSIPSLFTVIIIFLIIKNLTGKVLPAAIASFSLAFSYLFWLYSEIAEVFALHSLFIALLTFLLLLFFCTKRINYLYFFIFLFALSLCHHHTILFLAPIYIFFLWINRKLIPFKNRWFIFRLLTLFLLGLLPYLYLPLSALRSPALNWDNPVTLANFIRLITRADYGSFTPGAFVINLPFARIYQFKAFARFITTEFTLVGVVICALGCFNQFVKRRKIWQFLFLSFLSIGPFFLFYAAYPLAIDFGLATYERFLLPSYIFLVIWFGEGIVFAAETITKLLGRLISRKKAYQFLPFFELVFFIFPISFFIANYPKISILKNDRTAENLAEDILKTVPDQGILILSSDTPLFNTQYLYYTEQKRNDIKLIHLSKLYHKYYLKTLKTYYPDLVLPDSESGDFIADFFTENSKRFVIMSNSSAPGSGGFWLPLGLLQKHYLAEEDIPSEEEIIIENEKLWQLYQDPLKGSLLLYKNLMLADVLKVYADSLKNYAQGLFRVERYKEALPVLEKARVYQPNDGSILLLYGEAAYKNGLCPQAEEATFLAVENDQSLVEGYKQLASIYRECFKDEDKANFYEDVYQEKKEDWETKLESL